MEWQAKVWASPSSHLRLPNTMGNFPSLFSHCRVPNVRKTIHHSFRGERFRPNLEPALLGLVSSFLNLKPILHILKHDYLKKKRCSWKDNHPITKITNHFSIPTAETIFQLICELSPNIRRHYCFTENWLIRKGITITSCLHINIDASLRYVLDIDELRDLSCTMIIWLLNELK